MGPRSRDERRARLTKRPDLGLGLQPLLDAGRCRRRCRRRLGPPAASPPSSAQNPAVRISTLESKAPSNPAQNIEPKNGPRGGSSAAIVFIACTLGAPVIEPGGKAARNRSIAVRPGASRPVTVETRWCTLAKLAHAEELGHSHRAGRADPGQVVAHQVDDHQVLGPILWRAGELGGQGGVLGGVAPARPRALDRLGLDPRRPRRDAQEPLRRIGDQRPVGQPQIGRERRRAGPRQPRHEVERPPARLQPPRPARGRYWPGRFRRARSAPQRRRPPPRSRPGTVARAARPAGPDGAATGSASSQASARSPRTRASASSRPRPIASTSRRSWSKASTAG